MFIHKVFYTPIYEYQTINSENFLVQNEIKNSLSTIISNDKFENPEGWNDGVRTNIKFRYNTIKDYNLSNLQLLLDTHIAKFVKTIAAFDPIPLKLAHSWINLTTQGQGQNWHQHQDAVVSGTYYYDSNGKDGDIIFTTPNPFVSTELFPLGLQITKEYKISPKVGKIILFPGWLSHCVEKNLSNTTRISVSFNYYRDHFYNS